MNSFRYLLKLFLIFIIISCNTTEDNTTKAVSNSSLDKVEPTNWWVKMQNKNLQLMVYHPNISSYSPSVNYDGVKIIKSTPSSTSANYLFVDFSISETTKAGKFDIVFKSEKDTLLHTYELKDRKKTKEEFIGFNSSDAIYLITPDRFANADKTNDINLKLKDTSLNRNHGYKRHGGDLKGIINNIDYISNLGFTTVWPTPVLTNDMPEGSYHGYAITDYYQVDPRFGTLDDYKKLANDLRKKDMKLIMDQVANHCGLEHLWMKDLPFKDWVNYQQYYLENKDNWNSKTVKSSNHRRTTNQDIYASVQDTKGNNEGWFVSSMPDLNQRNPFMATYIIQNSIWWIETLQLGGIRQDTYPYPDKGFMSDWAGAIMTEYPNFSIVGEEWSYNPLLVGYWQKGSSNKDGYVSNLTSTMDFPMQKAIIDGINESETWGTGLVKIYEGLANDFHYANPKAIMAFLDNHDKSRIFTETKEDFVNTKMAFSYLMMLPRIPQMYYGTEILMEDTAKPGDHGLIRSDFPGGWENDKINAFSGEGLSSDQKEMQNFVRIIMNYRKSSKAIASGKTIHFAPENGVYILFRKANEETVVHIINKNEHEISLNLNRFKEIGLENKTLKNIVSGEKIIWKDSLKLSKIGSYILTTKL